MKKIIENNYLIKIDNIISEKNYSYFLLDDEYYYFVKTTYSEKEINNILNLLNSNAKLAKISHQLIPNINQQYLTNSYVLLKIKGTLNENISLEELIKFQSNYQLNFQKDNLVKWDSLWSQKIDYFEYQIREIGKEKKIIINSFSFFLGLAENACSYVSKLNLSVESNNDLVVLSHRRIFYPNTKLNFYNPLMYTIDNQVRDISSYIKHKFWQNENVWPDIYNYFNKVKLSPYSYHLFYARMLYPSFYFDKYEKIIENEMSEEELIPIISKIENYLQFLKELKKYLDQYVQIFDISWLNQSPN